MVSYLDIECEGVPARLTEATISAPLGVLVLPSIHGREPYIMQFVAELAQAGFSSLLWDLFEGKGAANTRESRAARSANLTDKTSGHQITALLDHMLGVLKFQQVAVVGFCLGGRYALGIAARDARLSGVVAYYPTIEASRMTGQTWNVVSDVSTIACPVHLLCPGNDHLSSREAFDELQNSLQNRTYLTSIQYFPSAEHAFLQLDRRPGIGNQEAARISKQSSLAFLRSVCLRVGLAS